MLSWNEIKPILRQTLASEFVQLGFDVPARAMWRYRPLLVDVVWFEAGVDVVAIEFACTPRVAGVSKPKPAECRFRVDPILDLKIDGNLLMFAGDRSAQEVAFARVAPHLVDGARRWVGKFESISSTLAALETNALRGEDHVTHAQPGSRAYIETIAELERLMSHSQRVTRNSQIRPAP